MKLLIAAAVLALSAVEALAQVPTLPISALDPHWGNIRKSPCSPTSGDNCGGVAGVSPPTFHITPAMCGTVFSTSAARNADGSQSTHGVRFTLPLNSEFDAAGYTASGPDGSSGFANRSGQCQVHFVMGLPSPDNYLRIGIEGAQGVDKITFFPGGAFRDMYRGDVVFPYSSPGIISLAWNGLSWLVLAAPGVIGEKINLGQQAMHGQGRLFVVSADPSWWTAGTRVGALAFCPHNGLGISTTNNSASNLVMNSVNCAFYDGTSGTATDLIGARYIGNMTVTAIAAGDAYGAGTAPNGVAYAAGNRPVLTVGGTTGLATGNTVEFTNLPTTLGTVLNGKFIVKVIDATHIQLHESISDYNGLSVSSVGPPASFVAGDTLAGVSSPLAGVYLGLQATSISAARVTNPTNGVEMESTNRLRAVVGIARRSTGVYTDTAIARHVASMFNPVEKKCQTTTAGNQTTTSASFVEVATDLRCNFVYLSGVSAQSMSLGSQGRPIRYQANIAASHGTAGSGCEFAVGFNGTTPETEVVGFTNPTGVTGGKQNLTITGHKTNLAETSTTSHYITLLYRAVGGGTCTVYATGTYNTSYHLQ